MSERGLLLLLSGPSGAGKGTVCAEYCRRHPQTFLSVSATTRAPREGERHGEHYYFYEKKEFLRMITDGELLEWAEYCGNYYGTPNRDVEQALSEGRDVILEIEVQGAMQVKRIQPDGVFVFVLPPSPEVLAQRLRGRNTESEKVIQKRLTRAKEELSLFGEYDYLLENDDLGRAADALEQIVAAERMRCARNEGSVRKKWML